LGYVNDKVLILKTDVSRAVKGKKRRKL